MYYILYSIFYILYTIYYNTLLANYQYVNPLILIKRTKIHFKPRQFKKKLYFCSPKKGLLAEWLGAGLQNHLLQFESGRDLFGKAVNRQPFFVQIRALLGKNMYFSSIFFHIHLRETQYTAFLQKFIRLCVIREFYVNLYL